MSKRNKLYPAFVAASETLIGTFLFLTLKMRILRKICEKRYANVLFINYC